jgi:hypothetical protein
MFGLLHSYLQEDNFGIGSNSRNQSGTTSQGQRFPLTGTIDQIGSDIERIKQIGVDHIVFGYNFIPTGRDLDNMLDITKQLARLAR